MLHSGFIGECSEAHTPHFFFVLLCCATGGWNNIRMGKHNSMGSISLIQTKPNLQFLVLSGFSNGSFIVRELHILVRPFPNYVYCSSSAQESIIGLALAMGRTLVMPPEKRMYLLGKNDNRQKKHFSFVDFYPIDEIAAEHVGFDIISMKEYLESQAMAGKLRNKVRLET
jgi:hypothetical protein